VQKQISLFFENDQITGIQGDFRPSTVPVIKTSSETTIDVPKRDLEKTLWEKITGLIGYDELDATPKTDPKKSSENNLPL
jgi:outer membrane protein assembly factor BamE